MVSLFGLFRPSSDISVFSFIISTEEESNSSTPLSFDFGLQTSFSSTSNPWNIPHGLYALQFRETLSQFQGKICGYFRDVSDLIEKMIPCFGISTCFNTWSLLTIQMASFLVKERFKFQNLDGEKWTNFI